ncbi:unnamed protein product, partial [Amoebophrya sp. A25]|eukprot:GSA25T00006656001.1
MKKSPPPSDPLADIQGKGVALGEKSSKLHAQKTITSSKSSKNQNLQEGQEQEGEQKHSAQEKITEAETSALESESETTKKSDPNNRPDDELVFYNASSYFQAGDRFIQFGDRFRLGEANPGTAIANCGPIASRTSPCSRAVLEYRALDGFVRTLDIFQADGTTFPSSVAGGAGGEGGIDGGFGLWERGTLPEKP